MRPIVRAPFQGVGWSWLVVVFPFEHATGRGPGRRSTPLRAPPDLLAPEHAAAGPCAFTRNLDIRR